MPPSTIESLQVAIEGIQAILTDIREMLTAQNGRQRENTGAIIRIVEAAGALTNVVSEQARLTASNTYDVQELRDIMRDIDKSSGRWSKGLAIVSAVLSLVLLYVALFRP